MKLERLLALIRLANNNPSEHEANAAARTVCKVLGANQNFMTTGSLQVRTAQAKVGVSTPDRKNTATWNDVKRSTEPAWRSNPPNGPGYDHFAEFFRGFKYKSGFDWGKAPHKDAPTDDEWKDAEAERRRNEEKRAKHASNYSPFVDFKEERESQTRKCSKCGFEVSTFRFKQEPFVCNPCSWKEDP